MSAPGPSRLPLGSNNNIELNCECGVPSVEVLISDNTESKGRSAWSCALKKCDFFSWKIGPRTAGNNPGRPHSNTGNYSFPTRSRSNSLAPYYNNTISRSTSASVRPLEDRPRCECENVAKLEMVKNGGPNEGKKYWVCANNPRTRCKFFQWVQDESEVEGVPVGDSSTTATWAAKSKRKVQSQPQRRNTTGNQGGGSGDVCFKVGLCVIVKSMRWLI